MTIIKTTFMLILMTAVCLFSCYIFVPSFKKNINEKLNIVNFEDILKEENSELTTEVDKIKLANDKLKLEKLETETLYDTAKSEIEILKIEKSENEQTIKNLEEREFELIKNIDELSKELIHAQENEIKDLETINHLTHQINEKNFEIEENAKFLEQLEIEIEKILYEIEFLENQTKTLNEQILMLEEKIQELEKQIEEGKITVKVLSELDHFEISFTDHKYVMISNISKNIKPDSVEEIIVPNFNSVADGVELKLVQFMIKSKLPNLKKITINEGNYFEVFDTNFIMHSNHSELLFVCYNIEYLENSFSFLFSNTLLRNVFVPQDYIDILRQNLESRISEFREKSLDESLSIKDRELNERLHFQYSSHYERLNITSIESLTNDNAENQTENYSSK